MKLLRPRVRLDAFRKQKNGGNQDQMIAQIKQSPSSFFILMSTWYNITDCIKSTTLHNRVSLHDIARRTNLFAAR